MTPRHDRGQVTPQEIELPLEISAISASCETRTTRCGDQEPLGLTFRSDHALETTVFDGHHAVIEDRARNEVWVEWAFRYQGDPCISGLPTNDTPCSS